MKPIPHGTANGYRNYGCRCDACRAAEVAYSTARRLTPCAGGCGAMVIGRYRPGAMCRACRAAANSIPLEERHGTETGYNKGCRCSECRRAMADARRRRRHANLNATRAYDREYYKHRRRQAA